MKQERKKRNWIPWAIGIAVTGAYHVIKGNGPFNKPRFAKEHAAVANYVQTHYPHAWYSPIRSTPNGWATVIRTPSGARMGLFFTKSADGIYVFHEKTAD